MAKRRLPAPIRAKVVQTYWAFLAWLKRRKVIEAPPDFPDLPTSDYEPTVVSLKVQPRFWPKYLANGAVFSCRGPP
jgi:hypothetical protein